MRLPSPREYVRGRWRRRRLLARRRTHEALRGQTPMLAVDAGRRGRFLVETDDLHIGHSLFLNLERQEMSVLERSTAIVESLDRTALRGSTLVDVGANIGTTTVPALVAGPFGNAVAIEPEPKNHLMLRLNLLLNGVEERVVVREAGASAEPGTARLAVTPGRSGNHSLVGRSGVRESAEVVEIETVTVDGLLREQGIESGQIGMLWIDAEGSEDRILAGAASLLEIGTPLVLELSPKQVGAAGGSQRTLEEAITRSYSHFVVFDLPPASAGAGGLRSVTDLDGLPRRSPTARSARASSTSWLWTSSIAISTSAASRCLLPGPPLPARLPDPRERLPGLTRPLRPARWWARRG